jgi:hypothetical protein
VRHQRRPKSLSANERSLSREQPITHAYPRSISHRSLSAHVALSVPDEALPAHDTDATVWDWRTLTSLGDRTSNVRSVSALSTNVFSNSAEQLPELGAAFENATGLFTRTPTMSIGLIAPLLAAEACDALADPGLAHSLLLADPPRSEQHPGVDTLHCHPEHADALRTSHLSRTDPHLSGPPPTSASASSPRAVSPAPAPAFARTSPQRRGSSEATAPYQQSVWRELRALGGILLELWNARSLVFFSIEAQRALSSSLPASLRSLGELLLGDRQALETR